MDLFIYLFIFYVRLRETDVCNHKYDYLKDANVLTLATLFCCVQTAGESDWNQIPSRI